MSENFKSVPSIDGLVKSKFQSQAAQLSDDFRELATKIVAHTPRPVYIKEVATMFIDEIIQKGDFVGIHWRYDLDDWLATNCKVNLNDFFRLLS